MTNATVLSGKNPPLNIYFWQLYEDELEDNMLWLSIAVLITAIFGVAGVAMAAGKEILIKEWQLPYARHYSLLLIRNRSWILTIHKARILRKKRFWTSKSG